MTRPGSLFDGFDDIVGLEPEVNRQIQLLKDQVAVRVQEVFVPMTKHCQDIADQVSKICTAAKRPRVEDPVAAASASPSAHPSVVPTPEANLARLLAESADKEKKEAEAKATSAVQPNPDGAADAPADPPSG